MIMQAELPAWQDIPFAFNAPFHLALADGQVFSAEQVVRTIPKKRLVAFGKWQGKAVVAKIFFDGKHAHQHLDKDIAGMQALQKNKIPTPAILHYAKTADKQAYVLIFERILEAKNLEEIWQQKTSVEEIFPLLKAVTTELATQHVLGALQQDLHLKNFLLTEKTVYTLDGAQIEIFPKRLAKQESMQNFALFLAQFGIGAEEYQEKLFYHYAEARGWRLKENDVYELFNMIQQWNKIRWKKFQKKIFRNSTAFVQIQKWGTVGMYARNYAGTQWLNFIQNPDAIFQHPTTQTLKAGRSSTVIKVVLDGKELVIKRYNLKNTWHRLRRTLRATRAITSWRLSQKLNLFGIPTAKPVAYIEHRYLGFRGKSYFITEYIPGSHANEFFMLHQHNFKKIDEMVASITTLLKNLLKLKLTHGDLKTTNILITPTDRPLLIDLDGTTEHLSTPALQQAWHKEITRFLKNFVNQPEILKKFQQTLL
jgi:tRNA A-37 threonylcarbamoyl transferase component Bud32